MDESYTTVQVHSTKHKWTIENFGLYLERAEQNNDTISLNSSSFPVANTNDSNWHLQLIFYGNTHEYKDVVRIIAISDTVKKSASISASFNFDFIAEGAEFRSTRIPIHDIAKTHRLGVQFKKRSMMKANIFLPNVTFTIICRIDVMGDTNTVGTNGFVPKVAHNNLANDIASLLVNKKFADLTLVLCNKKRVEVHKAILAARSRIFADMFEEFRMDENNKDEVTVTDIDSEILEKMLEYIYKNEVHDLDHYAMNLISLADKYELEGLMEMCEESLCVNMTVGNASEILVLADRHNAKELLKFARDFINIHIDEVMETEGYDIMESEYPQVALMLHRQLLMENPRVRKILMK